MESSFSSRTDAFPARLRVLVVDDDLAWLKILEKMLKKCSYEVRTCCLARDALDLLRERKDGFDIVISDVNMPDMDGFKLLEHVGLEMDLPVIMMSVDGETSRVMRGVQHGACDYLLKPIRMKELRNIWQHVFRKRIRDIQGLECSEEIQMMRLGSDQFDEWHSFSEGELCSGKKRKNVENKDVRDLSSVKKARVVWAVDLHQKFVKAVNQIGFDKVGPKKILDLMNVPWLTRENVASHLQKYRLYWSKLQKENDLKASFSAIKQSELSSKDTSGSLGLQNSLNIEQTDARNAQNVSGSTTGSNDFFRPLEPDNSDYSVLKDQFKQEHKVILQVEKDFNHLPSVSSRPYNREREKPAYLDIPWGFQFENPMEYFQASESNLSTNTLSMKNHGLSQIFMNKEFLDPNIQDPVYMNDAQSFEYEYPWEILEYPVIDQGLFIV